MKFLLISISLLISTIFNSPIDLSKNNFVKFELDSNNDSISNQQEATKVKINLSDIIEEMTENKEMVSGNTVSVFCSYTITSDGSGTHGANLSASLQGGSSQSKTVYGSGSTLFTFCSGHTETVIVAANPFNSSGTSTFTFTIKINTITSGNCSLGAIENCEQKTLTFTATNNQNVGGGTTVSCLTGGGGGSNS